MRRPDATGLFSDGRFLDFSELTNKSGQRGQFSKPGAEPAAFAIRDDDGERVYVAGHHGRLLHSRFRSHRASHKTPNSQRERLVAIRRSTIVSSDGVIDPAKIPAIANDCLHMVVNNDPGLKAYLASNASPQAKAQRYLVC